MARIKKPKVYLIMSRAALLGAQSTNLHQEGSSFMLMKNFIFGGPIDGNHHKDIVGALHPGEEILARVQQSRLLCSLFNPANLYITSTRIIRRDTSFFGIFSVSKEYPLCEILSVGVGHRLFFSHFYATLRFNDRIIGIEKISKEGAIKLQQMIRHPFVVGKIQDTPFDVPVASDQRTELKAAIKQAVLRN